VASWTPPSDYVTVRWCNRNVGLCILIIIIFNNNGVLHVFNLDFICLPFLNDRSFLVLDKFIFISPDIYHTEKVIFGDSSKKLQP